MTSVIEKFLKYVKVDTQSSENSDSFPSTDKQKNLAKILYDEMNKMGVQDTFFDEQNGYVYGKIPAANGCEKAETVGFIAHMDTSPEITGADVKPRIITDYDGNDIMLNAPKNICMHTSKFPELRDYVGKTLIVTDGTTLLGADDKAGVAEIMTMAEFLLNHKDIAHGEIAIAFTPDEEVGGGIDKFDLKRFGAKYAYTVDGGGIGELEYENFNAASAEIEVFGVNVHTGEAKNKMKNASSIAMEFNSLLPKDQKPELTEGYEGFFHLENMEGSVENAKLSYLIRDHDKGKFEHKKQLIEDITKQLNKKYGENTVLAKVKNSYFNMREKIEPDFMFLIERAKCAMQKLDIEVKIQPIRGGTDGAKLSFMGLPCPNICTGGHNFHGRYEYCCVESMEKIVLLLVEIARG